MVFAAFGGLVGSVLSDAFGRRVVANASLSSTAVAGLLLTLAPSASFLYFKVTWAVLSFCLMSAYTVTFIRVLVSWKSTY